MANRFAHIVLAAVIGVTTVTEARQGAAPQVTTLPTTTFSRLVMPREAAGKVPVVMFVAGGGDETAMGGLRSLASALAREGIAYVQLDQPLPAGLVEGSSEFESLLGRIAENISNLRNDIRFSTITVAGDATGSGIAAIAARVARADTSTSFTIDDPSVVANVIKVVRDLELPGAPKPRRNTGQRASLRDTTIATVDGARVSVEYGRPSKRGRVIWGNLVKWGGWWMPGADEATTLTTNKALTFGTLAVPAGDYTIYTHPGEDVFLLAVNSETGQFHTVYHPDRDLGRVTMTRETADPAVERLTFQIHVRPGGGGALRLVWDDRAYVTPFVVSK
jgi:hypothetical protein